MADSTPGGVPGSGGFWQGAKTFNERLHILAAPLLIFAGLVTALVGARAAIDTLWPAPSPSLTPAAAALGVPNVYAMDSATAITLVRNAGYVSRTVLVCSDSITVVGKVRQVLSDEGGADGIVLVDAPGVTTAGRALPTGAKIVLKVTTGARC